MRANGYCKKGGTCSPAQKKALFVDIEETNGYVSEAITRHVCLPGIDYKPLGAYDEKVHTK